MSNSQTNTKAYDKDALRAELEKLRAERDQMQAALAKVEAKKDRVVTSNGLTLGIGEKGGICVYGMGRFPVSMYLSQFLRFVDALPEILAFAEANKGKLAQKPAKAEKKSKAA